MSDRSLRVVLQKLAVVQRILDTPSRPKGPAYDDLEAVRLTRRDLRALVDHLGRLHAAAGLTDDGQTPQDA